MIDIGKIRSAGEIPDITRKAKIYGIVDYPDMPEDVNTPEDIRRRRKRIIVFDRRTMKSVLYGLSKPDKTYEIFAGPITNDDLLLLSIDDSGNFNSQTSDAVNFESHTFTFVGSYLEKTIFF